METAKDVSRSVFQTMEEIKTKFRSSPYIKKWFEHDAMVKKTRHMDDRELSEWNAKIHGKYRRKFDLIVRDVCKKNGRNEDHVRRVAGWKRGRNIINLKFSENE